jgi:hypothetical protein
MRIKQATRPDQESTRIGPKITANKRLVVLVEHKGIQYQVVQTANPTGFKWTVHLDDSRTKTGVSYSRGNAIFHAVRAIDRAVSASAKAK